MKQNRGIDYPDRKTKINSKPALLWTNIVMWKKTEIIGVYPRFL